MKKQSTVRLVESALLIAIAAVLELISKALGLELPFGGTITLASMFPIVLIAYKYGTKWGLLSGFTYSLVQMLLGAKTVSAMFLPGDDQMVLWQAICICLLDYVLAYTLLGLGGIFKGKFKKPAAELALGAFVALLLRYLVHIGCNFLWRIRRVVLHTGGLLLNRRKDSRHILGLFACYCLLNLLQRSLYGSRNHPYYRCCCNSRLCSADYRSEKG